VRQKVLIIAGIISALLFYAVAGIQLLEAGRANPYLWVSIPPPIGTAPPLITFFSPENNTVFCLNNVLLNCLVEVGNSTASYQKDGLWVRYKVDWLQNETMKTPILDDDGDGSVEISFALTDIPDGNHSVIVEATEGGRIVREARRPTIGLVQTFSITSYSIVNFTVDTNSPTVQILSAENKTYTSSNVPLNFTVNESALKISYVLDGQENVTIAGNTTLSNLPYGKHNITVYATDKAGNTGASETIHFTIDEPFPTTMVIAPVASVAFVGAGLLLYFKKRRR
jgi:hypothetical protein